MKAVIKLHLKENIKKNSFIIFGILGTIITLIVLFQLEFSVNGVQATSDHAVLRDSMEDTFCYCVLSGCFHIHEYYIKSQAGNQKGTPETARFDS